MNVLVKTILFTILFFLGNFKSKSQSKNIEIVYSEKTSYHKLPKPFYKLIDQVHLRHDSTELYCDSALFFIEDNTFEAFGNVLLQRGDSIELICDELIYFGNKSVAEAKFNVYLRKDTVKLFSDDLNYHIEDRYANYTTDGQVINVKDTINSKRGEFYFDINEMELFNDVYIRNSELKANSEYLKYNTKNNDLEMQTKVKVKTDSTLMYLDRATYINNDDKIYGKGNIKAFYQSYTVFSDSLVMQVQDSVLWVWDDVYVIDSLQQVELKSEYAELHKQTEEGLFIDSVFLRQIEETDTMFMYADTIFMDRNSGMTIINAYQNVKIWRDDLQAISDSIHFNQETNRIILSKNPVAWVEQQQINSDTIELLLENNELDSLFFVGHAFMISEENKLQKLYSQVKGRRIESNVENNSIESTLINGNAEVLYCVFDKKVFSGINTMNGVKLKLFFKENEISKLLYLSIIDGKFIPSQNVGENNRFLNDFKLYDQYKIYKIDFQVF